MQCLIYSICDIISRKNEKEDRMQKIQSTHACEEQLKQICLHYNDFDTPHVFGHKDNNKKDYYNYNLKINLSAEKFCTKIMYSFKWMSF